jgi:hypothetical protein
MICKHCGKRLQKLTVTYYVEEGSLLAPPVAAGAYPAPIYYTNANPAPYAAPPIVAAPLAPAAAAAPAPTFSYWHLHQPVEEEEIAASGDGESTQ